MSAFFIVLGIFGAGMWTGYALRVWETKTPAGNRYLKTLTQAERAELARQAILKFNKGE